MEKKIIIQQRDHIILPNATLKRFADKSKQIHYLDLNDMENISVKHDYPKSYHAIANYYDPEYDDKVKIQETSIGRLHKLFSDKIFKGVKKTFNPKTIKQKIIDFVTIEYNRTVIANDSMLDKYRQNQQEENDAIDKMLLINGKLSAERCEYSINFRHKAQSIQTFRYYAQNILGTSNEEINGLYKDFKACVLYIQKKRKYEFMLPPMHFVGTDCFLIFVLSPNICLALYPTLQGNNQIIEAEEERVRAINCRIMESVGFVDKGYREIVGGKNQLNALKNKIERYKSIFYKNNERVVCDLRDEIVFYDLNDVMEVSVALYLSFMDSEHIKKLYINKSIFAKNFIKNSRVDIEDVFKKYGYRLVIKSDL